MFFSQIEQILQMTRICVICSICERLKTKDYKILQSFQSILEFQKAIALQIFLH